MEVTEDCKTQVMQARRQMADAELATVEKSAKLSHDLKEALHARDTAESQLKQQADRFPTKLSQAEATPLARWRRLSGKRSTAWSGSNRSSKRRCASRRKNLNIV